jgi:hypothetical protein
MGRKIPRLSRRQFFTAPAGCTGLTLLSPLDPQPRQALRIWSVGSASDLRHGSHQDPADPCRRQPAR